MSATTRLSVTGGSQAANASYAGKVPAGATKAAGPFSRLHPGAHSRAYAVDSYAGKVSGGGGGKDPGWVTSLHMAGHSRARPLGSFAGKVPAPEVSGAGTYIPSIARRGRRGR